MRTQSPYTLEEKIQTVQGIFAICDRLMNRNEQPPEGQLYPPEKDKIERLRIKYNQQKITLLLSASREGKTVFAQQALEGISVIKSTNFLNEFANVPDRELAWLLTRLLGAEAAAIPARPGKADILAFLQAHQNCYVVDSLTAVEEMYLRDLLRYHYEWLTTIEADFHILFICRSEYLEGDDISDVPREYLFWSNDHIVGLFNHAMDSLNLPIPTLEDILKQLGPEKMLDATFSTKTAFQLVDDFCGHSRFGGDVPTYSLQTVAQGFHECFTQAFYRLEQTTNPGGQ
ncbi:MAG: hypothetical protein IPM39_19465 [Chloroflexi bacterium]|nr:hypothetical protein [Chloroflexota bacterium]